MRFQSQALLKADDEHGLKHDDEPASQGLCAHDVVKLGAAGDGTTTEDTAAGRGASSSVVAWTALLHALYSSRLDSRSCCAQLPSRLGQILWLRSQEQSWPGRIVRAGRLGLCQVARNRCRCSSRPVPGGAQPLPLLSGRGLHTNLTITGGGVIDGRGELWWSAGSYRQGIAGPAW